MKLTEENVEFLRNAFTESKDWLLKDFPKTIDLPFELAAELLLPHIPHNNITLRYLGGGYTRAKVILFRPIDSTPFVVKFGPIDAMREQNSHLGKRLPFFVRPERIGEQFVSADGKYASFAYTWAGGYDSAPQLRETVSDVSLQTDGLIVSVLSLMKIMMRWSSPRPIINKSVFDLWNWTKEREDLPLIRSNLQSVRNAENSQRIAVLENIIDYRTDWLRDVPVLPTVVGLCHGDLNSRNIVVSGPREHLSAKVIDLSDIKRHCPAYDWARLERDVKLLCLRDASPDAVKYAAKLEELNYLLDSSTLRTYPPELDRYVRLILAIREKYEHYGGETAKLDYLYMLLCWNIAHLNSHQWQSETSVVAKSAIIDSAYHTIGAITSSVTALRNPAIKSSFLKGTPSPDQPLTRTLSKVISLSRRALGVLKEHAVTVNIVILFLAGLIGCTLYDRIYPYKFLQVHKNEKEIIEKAEKIRSEYSTSTDEDFWTSGGLLFMDADEFYSMTRRDGLAEALEEFEHRPMGWQISEYEEGSDDSWLASFKEMLPHSSEHDQEKDNFHIDFDAAGNPFSIYIPSADRHSIVSPPRNSTASSVFLARIVAKQLFGFTLRPEDATIMTNVTWLPGLSRSNATDIRWMLPEQTDKRTRLIEIVLDEDDALVYASNRQLPSEPLIRPLYVHHDALWPSYLMASGVVIFILVGTSVYLFFRFSLYKKFSKSIAILTAALMLTCLLAANMAAHGLFTDEEGHLAILDSIIVLAVLIFLGLLVYTVTKTATYVFVEQNTMSEGKRSLTQSTMRSVFGGMLFGTAYSATTILILFLLGSSKVLSATSLAAFLLTPDISIESATTAPVCFFVASLLGIATPIALLSPRTGKVRAAIMSAEIWAISSLLLMHYDAPLVVNVMMLSCMGIVFALSALWGGLYSLGATAVTVATVECGLPVFRVWGDAYPAAATVFIPFGGLILFAAFAEFRGRLSGRGRQSAAAR